MIDHGQSYLYINILRSSEPSMETWETPALTSAQE